MLDEKYLDQEINGLKTGAALIIDSNSKRTDLLKDKGIPYYPVPFEKLSQLRFLSCGKILPCDGIISFYRTFHWISHYQFLKKDFQRNLAPLNHVSCLKIGYSRAEKNLDHIKWNLTENLSSKSENR